MGEALIEEQILAGALHQHPQALAFVRLVNGIAHFFDDVADGDQPLTARDAELAAWRSLVELPRNEFYRTHFAELNPLMAAAIQNWSMANRWEETSEQLDAAFILRSAYMDVITHALTLVGGREWGLRLAQELRVLCHSEGPDGYRENLAKQFEARR